MDEIEYKLNTNNSVLVVNAIDKLISTIKSKFKPAERQKFVLENEELKFLREKCSSKNNMVSLTACQGLLALVELGVLEIGHTMSTVVTLLPSSHNYSAIISTMAGLLNLDLKSRLVPGQPYTCQFSLRSPQHPFVTVLERNKGAEDDVIAQMHALCTHPDYTISSNSLELLRPVFLWLAGECSRSSVSGRPWQLLLSLPQSVAQNNLLLACISCQQICNPKLAERAFAAYSAVTDTAIHQCHREHVMAFVPMLARISTELLKHGRDPRACYSLIERCFALDAPELRTVAGITVMLLAENLATSSALYLHELFNLCLNIISKYEYPVICLNVFAALSLQWLHLPSYLTSSALKVASNILDTYQATTKEDSRLYMPNLKSNKTFLTLMYTDSHLSIVFKINEIWERLRDNPDKLKTWFDGIESTDDLLKLELLPFFLGIMMENKKDAWFEEIVLRTLNIIIGLVNARKEVSVQVLPVLLYRIAHDKSPAVKMECLKALPLMAKTKENVPTIVSILNKLKVNKGIPSSFLMMLYTSLAETQVRCFPYLQELLVDHGPGRPDDLKWEVDIAKAMAVYRICETRASSHGAELVPVISSLLTRCSGAAGEIPAALCVRALRRLWRATAVAPPGAWRALQPKLGRDARVAVRRGICELLSEVPALRVSSPEYDQLLSDAARQLWGYVAGDTPQVVEAACDALGEYRIEDYTLKDVPEIYRRTVKLPPSYCETPADAARNPEDVLDYIPCEIWPEVFKYTNQAALAGVQRMVSKLVEREIRQYRSGVYQPDARAEPRDMAYLPPTSVVRGLMDCFRRQATAPTYDFPDAVLLAVLLTLAAEYPKPLPPMDLCCIHEVFHRGEQWRRPCVQLAARQAHTSGSARRFLDNYLQGLLTGDAEASDILLVFELLPILCRSMPPNSLRPIIEKSLAESYAAIANLKISRKDTKNEQTEPAEEHLFISQLKMIKACLDCEKIHDANRTLLSLIVENYFSILPDDHVAWRTYVGVCPSLCTSHLERMSSPSAWWELTGELLRKAAALRAAVAATGGLVWLNEIVDAQATEITEQEFSLRCMVPALKAAQVNEKSTREWFLTLMARTQVTFKETEDESAKLYLCDVFMLSVIVFSGHWSFEPDAIITRSTRQALLPAAAAALVSRPAWNDCTIQLLEWLVHTRDMSRDTATARSCQRALLALRHTEPFVTHNVWKKLLHERSAKIVGRLAHVQAVRGGEKRLVNQYGASVGPPPLPSQNRPKK